MSVPSLLNLLVIDQDSISGSTLEQVLDPTGYLIRYVRSVDQAISTCQGWHPGVIIINIMHASSNGWNLCRQVQAHCHAPILVIAGISDPNSISRWLDAGADDVLTRPFSSEVLVAQLQKLTRRSNHIINNISNPSAK